MCGPAAAGHWSGVITANMTVCTVYQIEVPEDVDRGHFLQLVLRQDAGEVDQGRALGPEVSQDGGEVDQGHPRGLAPHTGARETFRDRLQGRELPQDGGESG